MRTLAALHGDKAVVGAKDFVSFCLGRQALAKTHVAWMKNEPVGFAVSFDWMNFVRGFPVRTLDLLYVSEKHRRFGVGRELVATLAKDALKKGILRLDTSASKKNPAANLFYKKLNFQKTSSASNKYKLAGKTSLARLARCPAKRLFQT